MDLCHLKSSELEPQFQKKKRQNCTLGWHCEGWFRIVRSVHWAGIICVTNDGRKSHGHFFKATRMRRTSSRRSISLHPGQNRRCTDVIKKFQSQIFGYLYRNTKWPKSWSSMEDPVVPLERNLYGHPLAGLSWERQLEKVLLMLNRKTRKRTLLVCVCGWFRNWLGRNKTLTQCGKYLWKKWIWASPHHSLTKFIWDALNESAKRAKTLWENYRNMFESGISAGAKEKLPCSGKPDADISSWSYDMEGHAKKCVERCCELANKTTQQLYKVTAPSLDDHQFKEEELKSVGELSNVCAQIFMKCLYLARIGRPDILWPVNKFARGVTKWTRACDKRLARLISCIHHTWLWRLKINLRWTLCAFSEVTLLFP